MSKCLVIGGNGFIGAKLADALAEQGHEVFAFDRYSSGTLNYSHPNIQKVTADFQNRNDIQRSVFGMEYVFHFLSTTTPVSAERDPSLDLRTNIEPSISLFEAAATNKVKRLIFASTGGAIYGDQELEKYSESDVPFPVSPYAIGKLTLEHYLRYFNAVQGLNSVSLRISNPYGPGQALNKTQGLIPIAIRRALSGKPLLKFGDGSMVRDFVFIDDLIRMIIQVGLGRPLSDLYNLGSGSGHSVNQVFEMIEDLVPSSIEIETRDAPSTFIQKVVLDISRFEQEFGKFSFTPLFDGISQTIQSEISSA